MAKTGENGVRETVDNMRVSLMKMGGGQKMVKNVVYG